MKTFKITVEYICNGMVDEEVFEKEFNSDAKECYKFISNNYESSVGSFSNEEKIIKIETIK